MVCTVRAIGDVAGTVAYFYYTEKEYELNKSWQGKIADELGFREIKKVDFENALSGIIKLDGKEHRLGRETKEGREHHSGWDLTFSAPKTVSIMALVAKDERVTTAHEQAVAKALNHIEANYMISRVQKDGELKYERTDNALIAKYTHITSRLTKGSEKEVPDPNLHTHCLIQNLTKCSDGKLRSIVSRHFYDNQMNFGELYRMELGRSLQKLGYNLEEKMDKGWYNFRIQGISQELEDYFSERRKTIEEIANIRGVSGAKELQKISLESRDYKKGEEREKCEKHWWHAEGSRGLEKNIPSGESTLGMVLDKEIEKQVKAGITSKSEKESCWKLEDLRMFAVRHAKCSLEDANRIIDKFTNERKLVIREVEGEKICTTRNIIKMEKDTVRIMQEGIGATKPILSKLKLEQYDLSRFSEGAKDAIRLALNTSDKVVGIQGTAGTGKTTTLNEIKKIAEENGYGVIGLACYGDAVRTLSADLGQKCSTLDSVLTLHRGVIEGRGTAEGIKNMSKPFERKIVVLDEASQASSKQMYGLMRLQERLNFRVVLTGDRKQKGAVALGDPFKYLQDHGMNTAVMDKIIRQKDNEVLMKAVEHAESAVDKQASEAKDFIKNSLQYVGEKNIVDITKEEQRKNKYNENVQVDLSNKNIAQYVYEAWQKNMAEGKKDTLVVVTSNNLRQEVNALIRQNFIDKGARSIDIESLHSKGMSRVEKSKISLYSEGDVLKFNKDFPDFKIKKGIYLSVNKVDGDNLILKSKGGSEYKFNPSVVENRAEGALEVYEKQSINLTSGDKIRWTAMDKEIKQIEKGAEATIENIGWFNATIKSATGAMYKVNLNSDALKHVDYAYSLTADAAQGRTVNHVIGAMKATEKYLKLSTQRMFYVVLSRARHSAKLVVTDLSKFVDRIAEKTGAKVNTLEGIQDKIIRDSRVVKVENINRQIFPEKPTIAGNDNKIKGSSQLREIFNGSEAYKEFTSNSSLIEKASHELFNDFNSRLSNTEKLRFGRKGSVHVSLKNGLWYDFERGAGDSVYNLYKDTHGKDGLLLKNYKQYKEVKMNTNLDNKKELTVEQKISKVVDLYNKDSIAINEKENVAQTYLTKHRKIDLSKVNLSDDVRYTGRLWCKNDRTRKAGLFVVARNSEGEITGGQTTYLDRQTANKDKSVDVVKKSQGVLKGSYAELTKNISSNTIYIAEGVETALSVAVVEPKARVICSLGVSNMKNIEFKDNVSNKRLVILADNDGKNSKTEQAVVDALYKLKAQGFKEVAMVKPSIEKMDFNDLLKSGGVSSVKKHLSSVLNAENVLSEQKSKEFIQEKLGGIKTSDRELGEIKSEFRSVIADILKRTENNIDFVMADKLTTKLVNEIAHYEYRYVKQIPIDKRAELYEKLRYEFDRKEIIKAYFNEKYPANSTGELLKQKERIERAVNIDARMVFDKNDSLGKDNLLLQVTNSLESGDKKISALSKDFVDRGMNENKALFMSQELVKYEERYGVHMPVKLKENLNKVGDYVDKHYNKMIKLGFDHDEAKIVFKEGSKIKWQVDKRFRTANISHEYAKELQKQTREELSSIRKEVKQSSQTKQQQASPSIQPQQPKQTQAEASL